MAGPLNVGSRTDGDPTTDASSDAVALPRIRSSITADAQLFSAQLRSSSAYITPWKVPWMFGCSIHIGLMLMEFLHVWRYSFMEHITPLIPLSIKAFLMITRRMHALYSTVDRGSWDTPGPPKKSGSVG